MKTPYTMHAGFPGHRSGALAIVHLVSSRRKKQEQAGQTFGGIVAVEENCNSADSLQSQLSDFLPDSIETEREL